jgi:hypothetical protein
MVNPKSIRSAGRASAERRHRRPLRLLAAGIAVLVALGGGARAEEALVPGTTSWWLIHTKGDRFCLAYAFYPDSGVALGFVSDGSRLAFGLANDAWHLEESAAYQVGLHFDGRQWINARLVATHATAAASDLDADAEIAFRRSRAVEVFAGTGRPFGHFGLSGSARAIDYVRTCGELASAHAALGSPADPRPERGRSRPFD